MIPFPKLNATGLPLIGTGWLNTITILYLLSGQLEMTWWALFPMINIAEQVKQFILRELQLMLYLSWGGAFFMSIKN